VEDKEKRSRVKKASQILAGLSNVKRIIVAKTKKEAGFGPEVKLNYSVAGPKLRRELSEVEAALAAQSKRVADAISREGKATVKVRGREIELNPEDIQISVVPPPGMAVEEAPAITVLLDLTRDERLVSEGMIRDIARRVQLTRKMANLNPTEILQKVFIAGLDEESARLVSKHLHKLGYLVRSESVGFVDQIPESLFQAKHTLDELEITVALKRKS